MKFPRAVCLSSNKPGRDQARRSSRFVGYRSNSIRCEISKVPIARCRFGQRRAKMWLRQHCVTATGPGVSLEARRWRGRSRILLLSKASLGASGTRPITSTSYCVCFTRHTVYLSLFLFHSFVARSRSLGLLHTGARERGIGQGDSRFLFAPIAPARLRTLSFSPPKYRYGQYIGIWPGHCIWVRTS